MNSNLLKILLSTEKKKQKKKRLTYRDIEKEKHELEVRLWQLAEEYEEGE